MHPFFAYIDKYFKCSTISNIYGNSKQETLRLVVDVDQCLDRLFGGFATEWLAGGDWLKFHNFQFELLKACKKKNIMLIYYFNGTTPKNHDIDKWKDEQECISARTDHLLNVIDIFNKKEMSPNFWIAPINLKDDIRAFVKIMRLNMPRYHMQAFSSLEHHPKELVQFCKKNKCHGILSNDLQVLAQVYGQNLQNIDFYSAKSFKLSDSGHLTAKLYDLNIILSSLHMTVDRFPIFAILLDGYNLFNPKWLNKFFEIQTNAIETLPTSNEYHARIYLLDLFFRKYYQDINDYEALAVAVIQPMDDKFEERKKSLLHSLNVCNDQTIADWIPNLNDELLRNLVLFKKSLAGETIDEKAYLLEDSQELNSYSRIKLSDYDFHARYNTIKHLHMPLVNHMTNHLCNEPSKITPVEQFKFSFRYFHIRCEIPFWMHQAYVDRVIFLPVNFEQRDQRQHCLNETYKPIRSHAYSIMFDSILKMSEIVHVTEVQYDTKLKKVFMDKVKVDLLCHRMGTADFRIDKLWCRSCCSLKERRHLLLICLDVSDSWTRASTGHFIGVIDVEPKKHIVPCLVLRYMVRHGSFLTKEDIMLFLVTINSIHLNDENFLKNLQLRKTTKRLTYLVSMFFAGIQNLDFLNSICGQPFYPSWFYMKNIFNCKLFIYYYGIYQAQRTDNYKDCVHGDLNLMNAVLLQYDFIVEGIEHYVRQAVKPPKNEPVHLSFKSASTPTTPVYPAMGRGLLNNEKRREIQNQNQNRNLMVKNFDLEKNLCNSLESIELKSKQNNSRLTASTRHQSLSSSAAHLEKSNAYAGSKDLFSSPLRALDKSVLLKNWQVDPDKPQITSRIRFPSYKPLTTEEILKFMSPNNRHLLQDDMIVNRCSREELRRQQTEILLQQAREEKLLRQAERERLVAEQSDTHLQPTYTE